MKRKKLTKKQQALIDAEREAKFQAWENFRDKYHGKTFTAIVRWFDKSRGEGMLRIDETLSLPIYACNITGCKTWYAETACMYYAAKQLVEVEVEVHFGATFAKGLTPGHLDSEKWERIKDQNLAFRCDETGRATNGLFA